MAQGGSKSNKKAANGLVAASAAAVLAVYAAGYERTQFAAAQLDAQTAERRPATPEGRGGSVVTAVAPRSSEPSRDGDGRVPAEIAAVERQPVSASSGTPAAVTKQTAESAIGDVQAATPVAPAPVAVPVAVPEPAPAPVVSILPAPAPAPMTPSATAPSAWKDGTYTGWGTCRHGDIQAAVVIEGGRIVSATIAQCMTRYSCSVIGRLPPEVTQRQSAEVDYVSGATQSADAFYYAVVDALNHAK